MLRHTGQASVAPDRVAGPILPNTTSFGLAPDWVEPALARLQACGCHTAIVTHEGRVAGLRTMDKLGSSC